MYALCVYDALKSDSPIRKRLKIVCDVLKSVLNGAFCFQGSSEKKIAFDFYIVGRHEVGSFAACFRLYGVGSETPDEKILRSVFRMTCGHDLRKFVTIT